MLTFEKDYFDGLGFRRRTRRLILGGHFLITSAIAEVAAHQKSEQGFINQSNESVADIWVGWLWGGELQWLVTCL